jgi:hypothetical protein
MPRRCRVQSKFIARGNVKAVWPPVLAGPKADGAQLRVSFPMQGRRPLRAAGLDSRVLATSLILLAALIVSCHKRAVPVVPPAVPSSPPAPSDFEIAENSFDEGNYLAAAKAYEACLHANSAQRLDWIHFRLGLAYALAGNNAQSLHEAGIHFRRLASQFPKSPYRVPAELILSLNAEIEKLSANTKEQQARIKALTEELQRLKAIDMKRNPSRPPG